MRTTKHAQQQQQRRAICRSELDLAIAHGDEHKAARHAVMYRVSRKELLFIRNDYPEPLWRKYRDSLGRAVPMVADGSAIVTAMRRHRKMKRLK